MKINFRLIQRKKISNRKKNNVEMMNFVTIFVLKDYIKSYVMHVLYSIYTSAEIIVISHELEVFRNTCFCAFCLFDRNNFFFSDLKLCRKL